MAIILKNKSTEKLYLNEKLSDVHFEFNINDEIHKVPANKANLAALSPVFDRMFFGTLKEVGIVKMVDASVEAFKEFLQIFYLGELRLTIENIGTVIRLADKYDVLEYFNNCATFTQHELTIDTICWALQLALFLKNQTLIEYCDGKIIESPNEVFKSTAFQRCDKETLEHILRLNLSCDSIDVFNACMDWARHSCKQDDSDENQMENLRKQLGNNLMLIRYDEMSVKEFTKIYTANEGLLTPEECVDIMLKLTMDEYEPKLFNQNPRQNKWDDLKTLKCRRIIHKEESQSIQKVEVLSFTSNQPVLLGMIQCSLSTVGRIANSKVDVIISQVDQNFHLTKILYSRSHKPNLTVCHTDPRKNLEKHWFLYLHPIFIKAKTMYEIRMTFDRDYNLSSYCSDMWVPSVELTNGLKISFHQNPVLRYDNSIFGWISGLQFNRI